MLVLLLAAALAGQLGGQVGALVVVPLLVTLLASQLDRDGGRFGLSIVRAAARLLPGEEREDMRDEWLDHVSSAGEQGLSPLSRAISIAVVAAPALAVGLRIGRARRRAKR